METPEYIHAEKAALRLIARAEQCSAGLTRKLEKRGHDEKSICKVINHLTELNLIDDSRFARFWLQSRLHFTRSPRQLLSALCARGIDRDDAEAAVKLVLNEETEAALLKKYVKKHSKRKSGKKGDSARSIKFILKNEGFSHQAIQSYLNIE